MSRNQALFTIALHKLKVCRLLSAAQTHNPKRTAHQMVDPDRFADVRRTKRGSHHFVTNHADSTPSPMYIYELQTLTPTGDRNLLHSTIKRITLAVSILRRAAQRNYIFDMDTKVFPRPRNHRMGSHDKVGHHQSFGF